MEENLYGVLKCKILETRQIKGKTPHFHIHAIADKIHYRIAINVKSQLYPYEVLYYIDHHFHHELTSKVTELPFGFMPIGPNIKQEYGLDYMRGNLLDLNKLTPLAYDVPGSDNDLNEKIRAVTHKALKTQESVLYAFGRRWGPEGTKDAYFDFAPGDGVHDIHMNQINLKTCENIKESWQDGGLLVHIVPENQWIGVFLAFQSQSI